jgi:hypothetical protein
MAALSVQQLTSPVLAVTLRLALFFMVFFRPQAHA